VALNTLQKLGETFVFVQLTVSVLFLAIIFGGGATSSKPLSSDWKSSLSFFLN
jgi:hypothetical protein